MPLIHRRFLVSLLIFFVLAMGACERTPEPSSAAPLNEDQEEVALVVEPEVEPEVEGHWWEREQVGPLHLGLSQDELVARLGQPTSKSDELFQGADGTYVEEWRYPALGLLIGLASEEEGASKLITSLMIESPAELKTSRGIGIGSSADAVQKSYGEHHDTEESEAGRIFVAESIYGGMIFTLEKDQVTRIFVGASAE